MEDLNISEEDLNLFLEELDEQIEVMEQGFLAMEREGAGQEVVSATFRAAHTVKGSSAAIGHQRMTALTHAMENVLDCIRQGQLTPSGEVMDALLKGLDLLRLFRVSLARNPAEDVDIADALRRLREVASGAGPDSTTPSLPTDKSLPTVFLQRLMYAQDEGMAALVVTVKLAPESIMPSVRAYQVYQALGSVGEVVASEPTLVDIEAERVGTDLRFWIITPAGREAIRSAATSVTDVVSVSVAPVQMPGDADAPSTHSSGKVAESVRHGAGDNPEENAASKEVAPAEANGGATATNAAGKESRTVRVDVSVLDNLMNLIGELVIDRTRLGQLSAELAEVSGVEDLASEVGRISNHLARITGFLQDEILKARMLPIERLFKKFPRMVRDLSKKFNKSINFIVKGEDTELDRAVIEMLGDPLIHLIRNAIDHGFESAEERQTAGKDPTGTLILSAYHSYNQIVVEVADDGRGIDTHRVRDAAVRKGLLSPERAKELTDREALMLIFAPGFSTAEKVSEISGRGVGLDVVRKNIDSLGGRVEVDSEVGRGTTFRIFLPLTLATVRALLVRAGGQTFALPLSSVQETLRVDRQLIKTMRRQKVITVRDKVVPLYHLQAYLGVRGRRAAEGRVVAEGAIRDDKHVYAVIVNGDGSTFAILVDSLVGEQEIVIKSLGRLIGDVPGLAGATILGDGSLALILDVRGLQLVLGGERLADVTEPA